MNRISVIFVLGVLMAVFLLFNRDACRTNAYFDSQKYARFGTMGRLVIAFDDYRQAHQGKIARTIDEAITATPTLFSPDAIERDARTNRTLQRVVLFHDVTIDIPHRGKKMHPWMAAIYVPRDTLPDIPGYRKRKDCIYWVGIQATGYQPPYVQAEDLVTCTDAASRMPPEIVAAAKAKYDADLLVAATQPHE